MESKAPAKQFTLRDALIPDLLISGPLNSEDLSYRELEEKKLQSLEEPLTVSKFTAKEIEKRNLPKEFRKLYDLCYLDGHKDRMNKDPEVQCFNRYCDILPFETTRVRLNDGMEDGDYVNANFIDSALKQGDRKMIAAQGPLEETVEAFWRMVLQEKVKLIVSVCKLQE